MTMDLNKGITNISYDNAGNLRKIMFSGDREIRYVYASDGTRLRTVHSYKKDNALITDSTDYAGNLVIRNGKPYMYMFPDGYYSFDGGRLGGCHYYIKDYLGSNRMVVGENGKTEQVTHYYPYGGIIGGIDSSPDAQPYKYEGKELDRTFGLDWYDIHARQYDPVIPSWHAVDPMCEKYYWLSPYVFCGNNPVNYFDSDGEDWIMAQYDNNYFIYYDSRIKNQNDIRKYYYRESELQNIKHIGKEAVVYEDYGHSKNVLFNLYGDGSYNASGIRYIADTEWNGNYGHINIGTDILRTNITRELGKSNLYGVYLGGNNPKADKDVYIYSVPPIDRLDYSAYLHDRGYDSKKAEGAIGALFNKDVAEDDIRLSCNALKDVLISNTPIRFAWGVGAAISFGTLGILKMMDKWSTELP